MLASPTGPRSARIDHDSNTSIPAEARLRPLRDQIIVEPLQVVLSHLIVTHEDTKPLRGIVKATGPGHYPKKYCSCESICYGRHCFNPSKGARKWTWDSDIFQPMAVKIGEVVELGGYDLGGYSFQTLWWGGIKHLICREADVSGVVDGMTADQAREEAARCTA